MLRIWFPTWFFSAICRLLCELHNNCEILLPQKEFHHFAEIQWWQWCCRLRNPARGISNRTLKFDEQKSKFIQLPVDISTVKCSIRNKTKKKPLRNPLTEMRHTRWHRCVGKCQSHTGKKPMLWIIANTPCLFGASATGERDTQQQNFVLFLQMRLPFTVPSRPSAFHQIYFQMIPSNVNLVWIEHLPDRGNRPRFAGEIDSNFHHCLDIRIEFQLKNVANRLSIERISLWLYQTVFFACLCGFAGVCVCACESVVVFVSG